MSIQIDCTIDLAPEPIEVTLLPPNSIDCTIDLAHEPIEVTLLPSNSIDCTVDVAPETIEVTVLPSSSIDVSLFEAFQVDVNYGHQGLPGAPGPPGQGGPPGPSGTLKMIFGETPSGLINGVNKNYTSANLYSVNQLAVFLNGIRQRRVDDYVETGINSFNFINAPLPGDSLSIDYMQP